MAALRDDECEPATSLLSTPRTGSGCPLAQAPGAEEDYDEWKRRYPSVLECWEEFEAATAGKRIAVFSDYDGTLTPIVDQPERAFMAPEMRTALKAVAARFPTAIISGRGLDKVTAFVQLRELYYAGSHGLDIAGPAEGAARLLHQPVPWAAALMDAVHDALVARLAGIEGAAVEHNKFCVSAHYRLCPERWPEVEAALEEVLAAHGAAQLHVTRGRKVFEVRPKVAWDKGKALLFLLDELGLLPAAHKADAAVAPPPADANGHGNGAGEHSGAAADVFAVYLGDDVSDEDAFAALAERGLGAGILVASRAKPSAARYTLRAPHEVQDFLTRLEDLGARRAAQQAAADGRAAA